MGPCPSLVASASHDAIARGVSPHPVDDDSSGWAEHQGCHDEDGGQDDQDDDPDIQDVLGECGGSICRVGEVHPARGMHRGDVAAPSIPALATTLHHSEHSATLSRETSAVSPSLGLRLLQEQSAFEKPQDL